MTLTKVPWTIVVVTEDRTTKRGVLTLQFRWIHAHRVDLVKYVVFLLSDSVVVASRIGRLDTAGCASQTGPCDDHIFQPL